MGFFIAPYFYLSGGNKFMQLGLEAKTGVIVKNYSWLILYLHEYIAVASRSLSVWVFCVKGIAVIRMQWICHWMWDRALVILSGLIWQLGTCGCVDRCKFAVGKLHECVPQSLSWKGNEIMYANTCNKVLVCFRAFLPSVPGRHNARQGPLSSLTGNLHKICA